MSFDEGRWILGDLTIETTPSAEEQEIYSLFDQLPRKLPTQKL